MNTFRSRAQAVVIVAAITTTLASAQTSVYSMRDKAFFAAPAVINFVRAGLVLNIESAAIASDGTIQVQFKLTDLKGLPLDRLGITTPGAVSLSFLASVLPKGQSQYTPYTADVQTSSITGKSVVIGSPDEGGAFQNVSDGEYVYTFSTRAPAGFDTTATHTIGIFAARDLSEFNLGSNYTDATFNFVPNGAAVVNVRDVVRTQACNMCHDPLSFHDGTRRSVDLCVLCHTAGSADPDTGLSLDFKVMVHKIHDGANLPSVKAGGTYKFIAADGTVFDYSKVVFPVGSDVRNCTICHTPAATQANNYITAPTSAACGSCHDDVNFVTGVEHAGGPQFDDKQCSICHLPQGELEFDASILGGHTIPRFSRDMPGVVFQLIRVDNGSAGSQPVVTFTLKDKSGTPIPLAAMSRVALVLSGPTTDYSFMQSEDATKGTCSTDGTCIYTFQKGIAAGATGTYTIGIEGERNITLQPGTTKEMKNVRDAGVNQVINFSVDGSKIEARRTVVDLVSCNRCHTSLTIHGDNRNQVTMCVLCHNPNGTDSPVRPASANPPQAINFALMIHKIHTGENLTTDYTIYGFGGNKINFNDVRFPGDRRNCAECHVNGSEQLPLKDNLLPVKDPRGFITPVGPTTSACTACHTDKSVASHALSNTTPLGEACSTCHGPEDDFAVSKVHAR